MILVYTAIVLHNKSKSYETVAVLCVFCSIFLIATHGAEFFGSVKASLFVTVEPVTSAVLTGLCFKTKFVLPDIIESRGMNMPIGVIINALSVAAGGVIGALFGHKLPAKINSELTKIFGVCSMGMGVSSIGLMKNMPAVIFAVIIGTAFGLAVNLGGIINGGATCMEKPVGKLFPNKNKSMSREEYMSMLVTIIVLFCASGTGIYGSLDSGMSGDHTILISKSILDFFTAMIFGGTLGMVVAAVAIPQCVIFLIIFAAAKFIFPLTTPDMIADFKACGGFLLLATGFRIAKIHDFPVADMIPAMVLVMPVSWFWVNMIVPML